MTVMALLSGATRVKANCPSSPTRQPCGRAYEKYWPLAIRRSAAEAEEADDTGLTGCMPGGIFRASGGAAPKQAAITETYTGTDNRIAPLARGVDGLR